MFGIDVNTCVHCGGAVRIVASIEEPTAIRAILSHFEKHGALEQAPYRPAPRARPAVGNRREMVMDGAAARLRDPEIPVTGVRSAPKPALAWPRLPDRLAEKDV